MGYAHLELHGQHGHARSSDRVGVLDAGDLPQHLLGRSGDHVLHINAAGSRKGNHHVGHGHVDLRLFFSRRDQHRECTQQQGHQRQQGRQCIRLKGSCNATRNAKILLCGHVVLTYPLWPGWHWQARPAQGPTRPHHRRLIRTTLPLSRRPDSPQPEPRAKQTCCR